MSRLFLTAAVLFATLTTGHMGFVSATAQSTFPAKPVKIVLPIPAGSALDVVTRLLADNLTSQLGQQVMVEDRPGAGGLLAAQAVATAPPDGYTLLGGASSIFTILPAQKATLPFDVDRDFTQIGMLVGNGIMYLAVAPRLRITSFAEFIVLAKSKPGEIVVGTNGAGTLPHYAGLALAKAANLPITIVPYNQGGTAAAIADIMGGRVHATIESAFGMLGATRSGDVKLIGAMSPERDAFYPDVPTVAATVPGFSAVGFMSLAAPAGTPAPVVRRLNESLNRALQTPSVKQRLDELGIPAKLMTPEETTAYIKNEQRIWWPLVKELEGQVSP
jgi:tripartite-type tricarboxylate transporter receptor subunit TctC